MFPTSDAMPMQRGRLGKSNPTRNALHLHCAGPFSLTPPDIRAPRGLGCSRVHERPYALDRTTALTRQPAKSSSSKSRLRPETALAAENVLPDGRALAGNPTVLFALFGEPTHALAGDPTVLYALFSE